MNEHNLYFSIPPLIVAIALHTHLEVEEEIGHAACDVRKITVTQPCSLWVDLLANSFVDLHHKRSKSQLQHTLTRTS